MTGRKTLISLLFMLTLVAGVSCRENSIPAQSSVILTFSTGEPVTRAIGDGNVADGGGIYRDGSGKPDLFIAIANYSGTVVSTYCGEDVEDHVECLSSSANEISIRFLDIASSGNYTVYAVANTAGGLWGAPANKAAWEAITSASDLDNYKFTALTGDNRPEVTDRMPLSAKGTLSVLESLNGHVELELLRCVAKVGFKFKNETGQALTLTSCNVILEDINPTQGYLFPQSTDDVTGTIRNLTLISSTLNLAAGQTTNLYGNLLVFPSVAPARAVGSRYFCDIDFYIGEAHKEFFDLPVHDRQSRDILALERNQYLQIETRINKGLDVSFNFEVHDWDPNVEDIEFH